MLTWNIVDIMYELSGILGTYTVFKLMHIFYKKSITSNVVEIVSYVSYFVLGSILYLYIKIPIVIMSIHLLFFFALTFHYIGNIKKKLLTTIYTYLFLFCIEMSIIKFSVWHTIKFNSILTVVSVKIISYVTVLAASKIWKNKKTESVTFLYWISIVFIPLPSLCFLLILFSSSQRYQVSIIISVIVVLLISFLVFYLYDSMIKVLSENTKKYMFQQESIYYKKQLELIQSSVKHTRQLKHDMKNHLLMLQTLYKNGEKKEGLLYSEEILSQLNLKAEYVKSGNIVIDSILNFKLTEAKSLGTQVDVNINIPENLSVSPFVLTTILGNLLDNAIHGLKSIKNGRKLDIKITFCKGNLIFQFINSFDGNVIKKNGQLLTTQQDKRNHGFGLENMKAQIKKCNGEIFIEHENHLFSVTVVLNVS